MIFFSMGKSHYLNFLGAVSAQIKYYIRSILEKLVVMSGKQSTCVYSFFVIFGVGGRWWNILSIEVVTCKQVLN